MKRKILTLLLAVVFLLSFTMISYAEGNGVDTNTSATVEQPTTTPTAPAAPATPAAPSAPAAPVVTAAPAGDVYVVQSGDVMWKIAAKYNLSLDELIKLNPQIKNPNLIYPGNQIVVKASAGTTGTVAATQTVATTGNTKIYQGLGHTVTFRNGPGKDEEGNPIYSFTTVMADVSFDAAGRIINAYLDAYEVATPNYDGASMPHFSGWPGEQAYKTFDHNTGKVTEGSTVTLDSAAAEVNGWKSKRERGDSYGMNPQNEWYKQMNFYQKWFVGKTVAELDAWFAKNTTSAGRPIKANTTNADDQKKLSQLTDSEKAALADVVAGATMSLRDPHGDFLGAIENAYANRVEVTVPAN